MPPDMDLTLKQCVALEVSMKYHYNSARGRENIKKERRDKMNSYWFLLYVTMIILGLITAHAIFN